MWVNLILFELFKQTKKHFIMQPNLLILAASTLIPFALSAVWYNPKVFGGDTWASLARISKEEANAPINPLKLALSLILNFFVAFGIFVLSVHQFSVFSVVGADEALLNTGTAAAFISEYGEAHRSFGHGMIHGGIQFVLFFIVPVVGYTTLFEFKSAKYFFVKIGFWVIAGALMGGVICAFS